MTYCTIIAALAFHDVNLLISDLTQQFVMIIAVRVYDQQSVTVC